MHKSIIQLYQLQDTYLDELYDRLWYEYWAPAVPHSKELKSFIREQLNLVAVEWNKICGEDSTMALKVVAPKDTWEDDGRAPEWPNKIYADVRPATYKEPAPVKKRKAAKEEDEDLIGEIKPAKKQSPSSVGVKGTYDAVAKLADAGKNKDEIQAETGFARKFITDSLWRWNKNKSKK